MQCDFNFTILLGIHLGHGIVSQVALSCFFYLNQLLGEVYKSFRRLYTPLPWRVSTTPSAAWQAKHIRRVVPSTSCQAYHAKHILSGRTCLFSRKYHPPHLSHPVPPPSMSSAPSLACRAKHLVYTMLSVPCQAYVMLSISWQAEEHAPFVSNSTRHTSALAPRSPDNCPGI